MAMKSGPWTGSAVIAIRERLQRRIDQGEGVCSKCGQFIIPGQRWDVDHIKPRDSHPDLTWQESNLGVAHQSCNRAAGAAYGNRKRDRPVTRPTDRIPPPSRDW